MTALLVALALPALAEDVPRCEGGDSRASELKTKLGDAEVALSDLELEQFNNAVAEAQDLIPCLADPINRNLAAETHRFFGIHAFFSRNLVSTQMFAAARSIEPNYTFPDTLVPEGNPILIDYASINVDSGTYAEVKPPESGYFQFDGERGRERPLNWPVLVQHFDDTGKIVWSRYVLASDAMPDYATRESWDPKGPVDVPDPDVDPVVDPTQPIEKDPVVKRGVKVPAVPLLAGAGVMAITTAALYASAGSAHGKFKDESTPYNELPGLQKRVNTMTTASSVTAAVTLGLGVGVYLTW